jgi:DNA polymerase-3 subunit delta
MTYNNIIDKIKKRIFAPVYFLAGEEPHYIDKISKLLEMTVVEEENKAFDQDIVYGKDVTINQVLALARGYPTLGSHRIVIVREAQNIKNLATDPDNLLKTYLKKPNPATVLVFDYKYKTIDKRTSVAQLAEKNGVLFQSKALRDYQVPDFIAEQIRDTGFRMSAQTMQMLAQHLGTNLSKIENELQKLFVNLKPGTEITPAIIEEYIGISKDYNIFELQNALILRDVLKANRIIDYFARNPKENPAIKNITILFGFFRKVFHFHFIKNKSDNKALAAELKTTPFQINDIRKAAQVYDPKRLAKIFTLLRTYDQKLKGVDVATIDEGELMKELIFKILH